MVAPHLLVSNIWWSIFLSGFTQYSKQLSWEEFTLFLTHMTQILSTVNIFALSVQKYNSKTAVTFLCFDTKQVNSLWLSLTCRLSWWNSGHLPLVWKHTQNSSSVEICLSWNKGKHLHLLEDQWNHSTALSNETLWSMLLPSLLYLLF